MNELAKFNLTRILPFTKLEKTSLSKTKLVFTKQQSCKEKLKHESLILAQDERWRRA